MLDKVFDCTVGTAVV
uniref:Uncharacterized protein n=1 Tax=Arundo donax TaxID=35708 RepID=A0A0A9FPS7_ARUDO